MKTKVMKIKINSCHECPNNIGCVDLNIALSVKSLISNMMRIVDDTHRRCIKKFIIPEKKNFDRLISDFRKELSK